MQHAKRLMLRCFVVAMLLPSFLLSSGNRVRAQTRGQPREEDAKVILPRSDRDKVEKFFNSPETWVPWTALTRGERAATEADKPLIDLAAQYLVYRVTWTWEQEKPGYLNGIYTNLDQTLNTITSSKVATQSLLPYLTERLLFCLKEVLQNDRIVARVNGARLLARVAALDYEPTADLLAEVLNDPKQPDAVKFWALNGLVSYFSRTLGPKATTRIKDEERANRCILALLDFVTRKPPITERTTPEEINGLRYVRREAVRALAETSKPAVLGPDKRVSEQGATALVLLRILRRDGVVPEPTIDEQVEAAVGLCQLDPKLLEKDYQPDYVAYHVGKFLARFAQEAFDDQETQVRHHPWKYYRERLIQALELFQYRCRLHPTKAYIDAVVAQAKPMLQRVEGVAKLAPDSAKLDAWLSGNRPKGQSVYLSLAQSVIKTAEGPVSQ